MVFATVRVLRIVYTLRPLWSNYGFLPYSTTYAQLVWESFLRKKVAKIHISFAYNYEMSACYQNNSLQAMLSAYSMFFFSYQPVV